jgi:hypothetical protein
MQSGTVASSLSEADLGSVMSAIANRDVPAGSLTVSAKFLVSGLSTLKIIGRKPRSHNSFPCRSSTAILPLVNRANSSTLLPNGVDGIADLLVAWQKIELCYFDVIHCSAAGLTRRVND